MSIFTILASFAPSKLRNNHETTLQTANSPGRPLAALVARSTSAQSQVATPLSKSRFLAFVAVMTPGSGHEARELAKLRVGSGIQQIQRSALGLCRKGAGLHLSEAGGHQGLSHGAEGAQQAQAEIYDLLHDGVGSQRHRPQPCKHPNQ